MAMVTSIWICQLSGGMRLDAPLPEILTDSENILSRRFLVFSILLVLFETANAIPRDLLLLGRSTSCLPIAKFYDRDGQIFPDFINEQDGSKSSSASWRAAFWCQGVGAKSSPYWLVFAVDGQLLHWDGCEPVLKWKEKPKGLRIHDQIMPLNMFFDLISGRLVKEAGSTKYRPLSDTYDGSGFVFYCHNKRWLYAPLD